jgi:hypothetical protein
MVRESLQFAIGQEKLPPEQCATRTALPPEACLSCRQASAKRPAIGNPAKMNLTDCKSN